MNKLTAFTVGWPILGETRTINDLGVYYELPIFPATRENWVGRCVPQRHHQVDGEVAAKA